MVGKRPRTSRAGRRAFRGDRDVHGVVQPGACRVRGAGGDPRPDRPGARPADQAAGRRAGRHRRPVRRDRGGACRLLDHRLRQLRSGDRDRRAADAGARPGRTPRPGYVDVRPIAESRDELDDCRPVPTDADRASRTCCAGWRRRSSARWCAATATSTPPRTPSRRRCSPRPRSGRDGVPDNPRGWLITVASRRLTDLLRARPSPPAPRGRPSPGWSPPASWLRPGADDGRRTRDDTLILLFLCCHPALSPASQIALTLRAVGGLTTAEIARAFLVPEATMTRRISRAKQTHQGQRRRRSRCPRPRERAERLAAVLHVLYLIFNEGYAATSGPDLQRTELSAEAIRLTRLLHRLLPDDAEVAGLLALMLLTDARRAGPHRAGRRADPAGRAGPQPLGRRGASPRASRSSPPRCRRRRPGPYQLQAAIAARARRGADAPRRPTGRRSSRCTSCSDGVATTRWSHSTTPSRSPWCTGPGRRARARSTGSTDDPRLAERPPLSRGPRPPARNGWGRARPGPPTRTPPGAPQPAPSSATCRLEPPASTTLADPAEQGAPRLRRVRGPTDSAVRGSDYTTAPGLRHQSTLERQDRQEDGSIGEVPYLGVTTRRVAAHGRPAIATELTRAAGKPALQNPGCSRGLKPPVSRRDLAM